MLTNSSTVQKKEIGFGYKLLTLVAMLYLTADLASCALAYKFVEFNQIFFSAEALIFPITYTITDIIAEVYGYNISRKIVWIVFLCDFLFTVCTTLLVHLHSPTLELQRTYMFVFGDLLRGSVAEIVGVLSGVFLNMYIISKLKIFTRGKYFWLRSIGSSTIGEAVLVITSMPIMFLGTVSMQKLGVLMLCTYIYKICFALIAAYPATLCVSFLKYVEKTDVYDYDVNFNPFALFSEDNGNNQSTDAANLVVYSEK